MAVLRPVLADLGRLATPLNGAELRVAEKLAELDDEWTVYVQPRLELDVPDFVAVHARHGVCAIEVKGWRYDNYRQNDDGSFDCRQGGVWMPTKELPRYQAYRYRSTIFDHFFALPDDPDQPTQAVRAVLILPEWSSEKVEGLFRKPSVTDREETVRVLGGDVLQGPPTAIVGTSPAPKPAQIKRLHRHLAESETVQELRKPVRLSEGARNVANNPNNARRRRVRGPAGCGKSFGLAARAARLAAERKRVLVLTFNTTLANYLRTLVSTRCREYGANPSLVTCTPFHSFCHRLVDDAGHAGFPTVAPDDVDPFEAIVVRARQACEAGFLRRFDAVLIDEGQDFTLDWWNLLREHIVLPDGEMLLVADPTQDVYGKRAWTDEDSMIGAGFSGQWTTLEGSYRMPPDLMPLAKRFAERYLDTDRLVTTEPPDHLDIAGASVATHLRWENVSTAADLGVAVGEEVVRLLTAHPDLNPSDVVFLCRHHDEGLDAVRVIESAGFDVHHIFGEKDADKTRRKRRFWPDAPGVKGCTVHSFKGWETPSLVLGIGNDDQSKRLAYVGMTRVKSRGDGQPSHLSIVNANFWIAGFQSTFEHWETPKIPMWPPPLASSRVH